MSTKKRPPGSEVEGLRPFWRPDSWREGQEARLLGRGSQDTKMERENLGWGVWQRQEAGQEHRQQGHAQVFFQDGQGVHTAREDERKATEGGSVGAKSPGSRD